METPNVNVNLNANVNVNANANANLKIKKINIIYFFYRVLHFSWRKKQDNNQKSANQFSLLPGQLLENEKDLKKRNFPLG